MISDAIAIIIRTVFYFFLMTVFYFFLRKYPKVILISGVICCIAAVSIFALTYTGAYYIGSSYTPFLLFGVGVLLIVRARYHIHKLRLINGTD